MGVGTSTLISLLSFVVATALGLTQLIKWTGEFRDRRKLLREATTKAEAERDSIAIKGAEGVLLMMQGMLDVAKTSEKDLRDENRELRRRIHQLELENGGLEIRLRTLESARTRRIHG